MNIGLLAQNTKKRLMQNFCIAYRAILSRHTLFATGATGRLVEEVTNLNVHKFLSGNLGGVEQLAAQIEHNEIDMMIVFRDPAESGPYEQSVGDIIRLCDMYNIPVATNIATAELLIKALERGDLEWREMYRTEE